MDQPLDTTGVPNEHATDHAPPATGGLDLHYARADEVDEFITKTDAYQRGEMGADEYRAYRLTRGVYGQRQDDVHMLRIKIPGGILSPDQARLLAEICDEVPNGFGNITTRENLQVHHIPLDEVPAYKARLNAAGFTQLDSCGNAVRTVVQDAYAGLHPDEVFDTTPYMQAITRFFLDNPRARLLPRKFKIALSTSMADRGYAAINDIGLIAVEGKDGEPAFRFAVGGGLASMPMNALVLHEAWPARDILTPCLAVIDMFQEHGNRRVRTKARIKHVLRKKGPEEFTKLYQGYLEAVLKDPPAPVDADTRFSDKAEWTFTPPDDAFSQRSGLTQWARTAVSETRLKDKVFITVRLDDGGQVLGDDLRLLADIAAKHGDGTVRFTQQQNVVLRAVDVADLPEVYRLLGTRQLNKAGAGTIADVTSCPGVSTCNLGITWSRHLASALREIVEARGDGDVSIKISGCHNSCGQHHVGTIGFFGAVRRIGGKPAPHYRVLVGGGIGPEGAAFGETAALVPARRAPQVVTTLLDHADAHRDAGETAGDYLRRAPLQEFKELLAPLASLEAEEATDQDFVDIGATEVFQVINRKGECAA